MITVLHGNCLEKLRELPEQSVHCVITSPPYWGLRDYKIPPSIWGGDPDCEHEWTEQRFMRSNAPGRDDTGRIVGINGHKVSLTAPKRATPEPTSFCSKCNAWRGVFGLEPTPELYLAHSLLIFAEVWRVLRDDGTLWVNLGDSYATGAGKAFNPGDGANSLAQPGVPGFVQSRPGCEKCTPNGGLVLRKGNWRCTTSHEYVFQFSKSDSYFCDAEAARERGKATRAEGPLPGINKSRVPRERDDKPNGSAGSVRASGNKKRFIASNDGERGRVNNHLGSGVPWVGHAGNRNRRSVWTIATKPYKDAHFATFPPDLVRPIVRAATPVKCCGKCGAPYAPVIERGEPRREQQLACGGDDNGEYHPTGTGKYFDGTRAENARTVKQRVLAGMVEKRVVDHRATCKCNAASARAVVLDPFGGSGTVGQVSIEEGRSAVLIEIAEHYLPLIQKRCGVTAGLAL